MNALAYETAKGELTKLEAQCREAFARGSFHPTTPAEMVHLIRTHYEYHRLSELRRELRERIARYEAVTKERANGAVNDNGAEEERARREERGGAP